MGRWPGCCNFWRNIVAARVICVDGPHLARWACVVHLWNNKLARERSVPEATLLRGMFATSLSGIIEIAPRHHEALNGPRDIVERFINGTSTNVIDLRKM